MGERPVSDRGLIDVHVERLAPGGDAVGRQRDGEHAGRATFVALAAPDEDVRVHLVREKPRVAWAELVEIRRPSPVRVPAPCRYFGVCGGCQWQHVGLDAQREAKREIVERALRLDGEPRSRLSAPEGVSSREAAGADPVPPVLSTLVAPSPSGEAYRERARFVVGSVGQVGFRGRRSEEVVDIDRCLVLAPALNDAFGALRAGSRAWAPGAELDMQLGREGVAIAVRSPSGGRPQRRGPADVDVAHGEDGGPPLRIPAGAFSQVGAAGNAALVRVVRAEIGPSPGVVLELHAGSGNFTRFLVQVAARVTAHDGDAAAVERGRRNVAAARWLDGPPTAVPSQVDDADVVLVDPPRDGLDAAALAAAVTARHRIVYVSCDPQTLGRDVERLAAAGFKLIRATALDLMPHTYHVETVATFQR